MSASAGVCSSSHICWCIRVLRRDLNAAIDGGNSYVVGESGSGRVRGRHRYVVLERDLIVRKRWVGGLGVLEISVDVSSGMSGESVDGREDMAGEDGVIRDACSYKCNRGRSWSTGRGGYGTYA
jgi:hypothetical protein